MKDAHSLTGYLSLLMSIIVGGTAILMTTVVSVSADTGDWRRVSAPPPPGPYRAVNLDPRIPGQAGTSARGNIPLFPQPTGNRVPDTSAAAKAAGGRANYRAPVNPASVRQAPMKQVPAYQAPVMRGPVGQPARKQPLARVPGAYQNRTPELPVKAWPRPSGYMGQMDGQDFGSRPPPRGYYPSQPYQAEEEVPPPRGYYPSQPYQAEEEVPPPAVYDAMMQAPPGAYQSGAGR